LKTNYKLLLVLLFAALVPWGVKRVHAQNNAGAGAGVVPVQLTTPYYSQVPITATAAVNTQTTLTIPAPAGGQYNYVCSLAYNISFDATGAAISNLVSTSTNFASFAVKASNVGTASTDTGVVPLISGTTPGFGCVKSAAPGVTTTFVSPASVTHGAWTWYATYYQAP